MCANSNLIGYHPINLGTGNGTSVLELVAAFEKASGVPTVNDFFVFVHFHFRRRVAVGPSCNTDRLDFDFRIKLDLYD